MVIQMSPTFATVEGLRFYFYMADLDEPPHAHVDEGRSASSSDAKIWLDTLTVASSGRLNSRQLSKALRIARENQQDWLYLWRHYESNR
jgi:hypothetical protein